VAADATGTRVVDGPPATVPLLVKAALPAVPGLRRVPSLRRRGSTLPGLTLTRYDVVVDRGHLAAYSGVCGFPLRDALPLTYPHVLAFGLHLTLMTDGSFPFPAVGTVHLANSITAHRAIAASERLRVTVRADRLRAHPKGRVFDVLTAVHSGDELVWEEASTFLRPGGGVPSAPAGDGQRLGVVPGSGIVWRLPADLGRRYAAVSGDHNLIHLYRLTAKAFGFPRQIAHGMWSTARCLAALQGRLPDAVGVDVAYKLPVLLPGRIAFGATAVRDGYAFSLTEPTSGAPHLVGRSRSGER
jgi:acyl dehydratase